MALKSDVRLKDESFTTVRRLAPSVSEPRLINGLTITKAVHQPGRQIQDERQTPDHIFFKSLMCCDAAEAKYAKPHLLHSPRAINSFNDVLFVVIGPFLQS